MSEFWAWWTAGQLLLWVPFWVALYRRHVRRRDEIRELVARIRARGALTICPLIPADPWFHVDLSGLGECLAEAEADRLEARTNPEIPLSICLGVPERSLS